MSLVQGVKNFFQKAGSDIKNNVKSGLNEKGNGWSAILGTKNYSAAADFIGDTYTQGNTIRAARAKEVKKVTAGMTDPEQIETAIKGMPDNPFNAFAKESGENAFKGMWGHFSGAEFAGEGMGTARALAIGARAGTVAAGAAAADFLNPFSLGWND